MESILQPKKDREQLPFSITVLRKHSLSRKANVQSQQATWGLSPRIHWKEALNFKCKKLFLPRRWSWQHS